ncbi:restriction endonuclease subunit S [Gemmiger formicilis]|jgi:type I restriction enzyme S subunit|uniref:restriction endonuclease subunit S n=2 Tax=Gemmiger formicilis TaxID=745368 RepID=UPI00399B66C2
MTGQQLKNSILQMAVQGKLVPQDPNDEPASVLLERIRAEKEKLIKEGKIKKEKNPSVIFRGADNLPYEKIGKNDPVCIADEVPFEIPESWEWVRLGSVCQLNDGKKLQSKTYNNLDARYMRGKAEAKVLEAGKFVTKGTYLILVDGENSGEVFIAPEDGYMGSTFKILWISAQLYARYILKFIELYKEPLRNSKKGAAIPHLNKEIFFNLLLPVPSLQEQTRIVDKIVELTPSVERYDLLSRRSDELNRNFPNFLKKSILQYAVQGKLVSQDPTDEPASVLLEHIRAEKEKLIKSGKIKRDKHESVIFRRDNSYYERVDGIERCIDDEIPFEIPENWEVVRLQNIGEYRKGPFGSSLTKSMFVPKSKSSIKVYEQKNAIQKDCTLGTYYIPMEYYNEKMKGFTVLPNDIIVSCAGTIGETYILPSSAEIGIINQALMRMRITSQINVDYFLIYFDYMVKETARESSKGSAIKNIPPFDIFKKIILPLPPLKEQKRIVQEVQTIQSLISSL